MKNLNYFVAIFLFFTTKLAFSADNAKLLSYECADEITGIVQNISKKDLRYVQILIPLYKSDIKIGDAMANVSGIDAGGKWAFKAITLGKDFDKCGTPKITAY